MTPGLSFKTVDIDPDYLGIDIQAANNRFAGSAHIYTNPEQLTEFANRIAGFPTSPTDERKYEFGTPDPTFVGGYCTFRFYCIDRAGHVRIETSFEDDAHLHDAALAKFTMPVQATAIDRFAVGLRDLARRQTNEAILPPMI